mmetsp:Transcript_8119/g.13504  ORF Transcript_8119/g.13504 Transcript_8119/m.13504 type:complete len:387 (+) Transcript_8119:78-1238(+)
MLATLVKQPLRKQRLSAPLAVAGASRVRFAMQAIDFSTETPIDNNLNKNSLSRGSESPRLQGFHCWSDYSGPLLSQIDIFSSNQARQSTVHGYEWSSATPGKNKIRIAEEMDSNVLGDENGAVYGYVICGAVDIYDDSNCNNTNNRRPRTLYTGEYFCIPAPASIHLLPHEEGCNYPFMKNSAAENNKLLSKTRLFVVHTSHFHPLRSFGGPIEESGRLKYIDGCSDTLLISPPKRGDPCLNLLHFPANVQQTAHTHPSTRFGVVVRGSGQCVGIDANSKMEKKMTPLYPGMIFAIEKDMVHSFSTTGASNNASTSTMDSSSATSSSSTIDNTGSMFTVGSRIGLQSSIMDVIAFHPDTDWGPQDENHPMVNRTWDTITQKPIIQH